MKKKKKEPNNVMSNLNIVAGKGFCAYTQSRVKNVFRALKEQLEPEEYEMLLSLYSQTDVKGPDAVAGVDDCSPEHEEFAKYAKSLMHKYAKIIKKV